MATLIARQVVRAVLARDGRALLPDNDQWTNRFHIKSASSSRLYVIAQHRETLTWGCDCPAWKFRRSCKHLDAIVPQLQHAQRVFGALPAPDAKRRRS